MGPGFRRDDKFVAPLVAMTVIQTAGAYVSIYPVDPMPAWVAALRASTEPVWLFAYGSVMWNPEFAFPEARPGFLYGYHRSFCLYSRAYRRTPERPGLVLGLDRGGACPGIASRLPPHPGRETLPPLSAPQHTRHTPQYPPLPATPPPAPRTPT